MAYLNIDVHRGGGWNQFPYTRLTGINAGELAGPKAVYGLGRLWVFWQEGSGKGTVIRYLTIDEHGELAGPRDVEVQVDQGKIKLDTSYTPGVNGSKNMVTLAFYVAHDQEIVTSSRTSVDLAVPFGEMSAYGGQSYNPPTATPTLAQLGGQPRLAWVQADQGLYIVKPDHNIAGPTVNGVSECAVGLAGYQGYLHVAYTTHDNSVMFLRADPATAVGVPVPVPTESVRNPTGGMNLAVYKGVLHGCYLTSDDGYGRIFRFDGCVFGPAAPFSTVRAKTSLPSMAAAWEALYCVYASDV